MESIVIRVKDPHDLVYRIARLIFYIDDRQYYFNGYIDHADLLI